MQIGSPSTDKMGTGANFIRTVLQIKRSVNRPCSFVRSRQDSALTIEIINNTRGGIEAKIWERANGGQI